MAFPDAWEEVALISISKISGTNYEFMAITETIDIATGDYPGESIPNIAGGRIWKQSPEEDGEITLEMYPVSIDVANNGGLFQWFNGGDIDSSQPLTTDTSWVAGVSRVRDKFRVAILWTNDADASAGYGATAASTDSLRFYATDCRLISHKAEFTDGILKITATFKFPAMNKAGTTKCYAWQSGDNTALASLGDYT